MPDDVFVDTNILVYAHDRDAGAKHICARELVKQAWMSEKFPALSVQVLQELFVTLCRRGVDVAEAREIARDYSSWRVVDNTVPLCLQAMGEMERWQLSFWDGLILAAARSMQAKILWSEDLNTGQDFDGIRVVNPLAACRT